MIRFKTLALLIAVIATGCARDAAWHIAKAQKKNPDLFAPDTIRIETPPVVTEIDCDSIAEVGAILYLPVSEGSKDSVRIEFQTVYKYRDREVTKEVALALTAADSLAIEKSLRVEVDCPDVEVVPDPVIIVREPTFWEKVEFLVAGGLGLGVLFLLIMLVRRFRRRN